MPAHDEVARRRLLEAPQPGEAGELLAQPRAPRVDDVVPGARHVGERCGGIVNGVVESRESDGVGLLDERAERRELRRGRPVQQQVDPQRRIGEMVAEAIAQGLDRVTDR
jgi:hypothetical protein